MSNVYTNPKAVPATVTGAPVHYGIDPVTNKKGFFSGASGRGVGDTITAHAGGGQASATQLVADVNVVTVVATAADSVKLPASAPGMVVYVENAAANSMQVFGAGTDTINAVATATGVAQAAGKSAAYFCATAGAWFRILSA